MSKVYTVAPGTDDERKLRVEVSEENPDRFLVTLDLGTEHEKTVGVGVTSMRWPKSKSRACRNQDVHNIGV